MEATANAGHGDLKQLSCGKLQDLKEQTIREQAAKGQQPGAQIMQARQKYESWGNVSPDVYDEGAATHGYYNPEKDDSTEHAQERRTPNQG